MKNSTKYITLLAMTLAGFAAVGFAKTACEKGHTAQKTSESTVTTNENGSVSRAFTEMSVSTNGNMVTEHRRETRTTTDAEGNLLATTTSEYAQSYPVTDQGQTAITTTATQTSAPAETLANDSFLGLTFGAVFEGQDFTSDPTEPGLLRTVFTPKKPLAGFDDYFVYVTPKTHRIVKVFACAKQTVEPTSNWRRHYLVEALEKRYQTWARLRSWCQPIYTFDIGSGRYVTAYLSGATHDYQTVLVGWDENLLPVAADEVNELRQAARKAVLEKRKTRVSDTMEAF